MTAIAQSAYEYLNSTRDVRQCKSVTVTSRRAIFVFRASFSAVCSLNVLMRQRLAFFKGLFVYTLTSLALAILSSCVTTGFYVHILRPLFLMAIWPIFGPSRCPSCKLLSYFLSPSSSVSVKNGRCPFVRHTPIYL